MSANRTTAERGSLRELVALLRYARLSGVLGVAAVVVCVGIAGPLQIVVSGLLIQSLADSLTDSGGGDHGLVTWIIVLAVLLSVAEVGSPLLTVLGNHLGSRIDQSLQQRVMAAAARPSGIGHLDDPVARDLLFRAAGIGAARFTPGSAVAGLGNKVAQWLQVVLAGLLIVPVFWWLPVVLLGAQVAFTWTQHRQYLRQMEVLAGQTAQMRRSEYFRELALTPEAAKEVRVFGLSGWLVERFRVAWLSGLAGVWRDRAKGWTSQTVATVAAAAVYLAAFVIVGLAAVAGSINLGMLAIALRAVMRVASGVPADGTDLQIAYGAAALPAVTGFEALSSNASGPGNGQDEPPAGDIVLSGLTFTYPGGAAPVLNGLDLTIPAGRSLAVVGANGAGKTTLVKVLCRLLDPTAGRIEVGGRDLGEVSATSWQRRVAPIFQNFLRYELSMRDNITFGALDRGPDPDLARGVAERAGILDRIDSLPHGWETPLAAHHEGGVNLSGGEWQRVALARALFAVAAGASILVMDEPTANLDVRAEADFYDRFFELTTGTTAVVISHRFASVRRADLICVLDTGRIAELGTHEELVARGGRYARMFALQAAGFGAAGTPEGVG